MSNPHIVARFDLAAGQTPEDFALAPGGAADVSFAYADEVARVTRVGNTQIVTTSITRLPRLIYLSYRHYRLLSGLCLPQIIVSSAENP